MKIKLNRKHLPKRIAVITAVVAALFAMIWLLMFLGPFCFYDRHFFHMMVMWVFRILNVAAILGLFLALIQRIHEITQGDDDDAGKY